jgi:drug/metabolite transporter (DMT)-like permease
VGLGFGTKVCAGCGAGLKLRREPGKSDPMIGVSFLIAGAALVCGVILGAAFLHSDPRRPSLLLGCMAAWCGAVGWALIGIGLHKRVSEWALATAGEQRR